MFSKTGQVNNQNQRVGVSQTKSIQRVGQMVVNSKSMNNKSIRPNTDEQETQYNKYSK